MRNCTEISLSPQELRRMQLIQLDMLIELDRICTKHNIKYIIDGGTLLGAVRHKGFIPWDDDIDVSMLRREYERFCEICNQELDHSKYFFQNHYTDPPYRWGYSKILRKGTEFERLGQEHIKMRKGVFIDVFPMDGVPKNRILWYLHNALCFCLRKIMWSEVGKLRVENAAMRMWYKLLNLIPIKIPFDIIESLSKVIRAEESQYVNCWTTIYCNQFQKQLKREYYTRLKKIEFEGYSFLAPEDTDGWLRAVYGADYMQLPPLAKRKGKATASYVDLKDINAEYYCHSREKRKTNEA